MSLAIDPEAFRAYYDAGSDLGRAMAGGGVPPSTGMLHYDRLRQPTYDGGGNALGRYFDNPYRSHDGKYYDSSGAFLLGELVRLDQTTHLPLASVSWGRDVDLRQDVTIADDATSWTLSWFSATSGIGTGPYSILGGKAWVGRNTTELPSVAVDLSLQTKPLRPWALELAYTIFELESALRLGRPIDQQKYLALQMKHQMDICAAGRRRGRTRS